MIFSTWLRPFVNATKFVGEPNQICWPLMTTVFHVRWSTPRWLLCAINSSLLACWWFGFFIFLLGSIWMSTSYNVPLLTPKPTTKKPTFWWAPNFAPGTKFVAASDRTGASKHPPVCWPDRCLQAQDRAVEEAQFKLSGTAGGSFFWGHLPKVGKLRDMKRDDLYKHLRFVGCIGIHSKHTFPGWSCLLPSIGQVAG